MEKYEDTQSRELALGRIYEAKTIGDILTLIDETFPTWIIGFADRYSDNFNMLNENWESICKMCKVSKKKVILVNSIDILSDKQTCIRRISEILTRIGYSVRTINEMSICNKCSLALPCKKIEELISLKYPNHIKKFDICCS